MLKIYGRANSINVRKVLWTVDEIGLPYTREDWGRGFRPTTEPEFTNLNPFALVPVIDDEGTILRESHAISRYLANKHSRTDLYPNNVIERAKVESWMDWGQTELAVGMRAPFLGLVVKQPAYSDPKLIEFGVAEWTRQMQHLDAHLAANGPYLMGSNFTLADVPAGVAVNRWFSVPFDKPELKAVQAYYDRLAERPAYQKHGRNGMP